MPGEQRCLVGVQVGLAGQVQVERLQPPGRLQQQRRRVAVQARGERDLPAQQVRPGALQLIQRPGLRHREQVQRLAERAGPPAGLRRGQRAPGAARRIGRQRRRPLPERRGGRQPAAGLRPPGRPFELGGHVLIRTRRGRGPVPGPPVRIGLRIGGLGQRRVRPLPVRDRGRPVDRRTDQRMPEPHPAAELHQARLHRRPRRRRADPELPGGPPHQHRIPGRVGRRHQQQPPGLSRQRGNAPPEAVLDAARPAAPRRAARTRPPAPPPSDRRGSSSSASGLPPVSATIWSRTRASNGPASTESSSARASASGSPPTTSSGSPPRSPPGARVPNTTPTDSAPSRRAANASTCADARSSHCASSTRHTSGCFAAASASRPSTASPTRNRSGTGPALMPNAVRTAAACGPGSTSSRSSSGAHTWCSPAKASSISDWTPAARTTWQSDRPPGQVVQQRRLARPRLAVHHQRPALTRADRLDQLVKRGALRPAVRQPRRAAQHRET